MPYNGPFASEARMAEFDEVLRQAKSLGQALAAHPRVAAYIAAQAAVHRDSAARSLLSDYDRHVQHVHSLEVEGKPIEVADKHKLRDLQSGMAGNESLKQLMRTQADYLELMNRIHDVLETPIGEALMKAQQDAK
jgi:cell fate (sporulation/competence/biofilm development) regulator YlbF (YheA/YmcA/DUF963 family)